MELTDESEIYKQMSFISLEQFAPTAIKSIVYHIIAFK